MAVGCVLLPLGSLRRVRFCLGAYALDYLEEESKICEPCWTVPPGVARVGHVPALGVGFRIHQSVVFGDLVFGPLT